VQCEKNENTVCKKGKKEKNKQKKTISSSIQEKQVEIKVKKTSGGMVMRKSTTNIQQQHQ
jgi:hypothetical protein